MIRVSNKVAWIVVEGGNKETFLDYYKKWEPNFCVVPQLARRLELVITQTFYICLTTTGDTLVSRHEMCRQWWFL